MQPFSKATCSQGSMRAVGRMRSVPLRGNIDGAVADLICKEQTPSKNSGRPAEKSYVFVTSELHFRDFEKLPDYSRLSDIFFADAAFPTAFLCTVLLVIPKFFGASPMQGWQSQIYGFILVEKLTDWATNRRVSGVSRTGEWGVRVAPPPYRRSRRPHGKSGVDQGF